MRKAKVLAVDDDPLSRDVMEALLAGDYALSLASSGTEAIERARDLRPDLVLMDIMMPGMDGYEACRRMREVPDLRWAKIILVSAKGQAAERLEGYSAGADDFITKPFDHAELLAKVSVFHRLKFAEEMDAIKSDFLTLVSHETRTPLTTLIGALDLLAGDRALPAERHREILQLVRQAAEDLRRLLELGQQYCTVRAGRSQLTSEYIDATAVVKDVLASLASKAQRQGTVLVLDAPERIEVETDRRTLSAALQLAVDALLTRLGRGGQVRVECRIDAAALKVAVCAPIACTAPDEIHRMLEPFGAPDVLHYRSAGMMNLPVAAELMRSLRGALQLAALPGGEMEAVLSIPASEEGADAA